MRAAPRGHPQHVPAERLQLGMMFVADADQVREAVRVAAIVDRNDVMHVDEVVAGRAGETPDRAGVSVAV